MTEISQALRLWGWPLFMLGSGYLWWLDVQNPGILHTHKLGLTGYDVNNRLSH